MDFGQRATFNSKQLSPAPQRGISRAVESHVVFFAHFPQHERQVRRVFVGNFFALVEVQVPVFLAVDERGNAFKKVAVSHRIG